MFLLSVVAHSIAMVTRKQEPKSKMRVAYKKGNQKDSL